MRVTSFPACGVIPGLVLLVLSQVSGSLYAQELDTTNDLPLRPRYVEPMLVAREPDDDTVRPQETVQQTAPNLAGAQPEELRDKPGRTPSVSTRPNTPGELPDLLWSVELKADVRVVLHHPTMSPELPDALSRMFRALGAGTVEQRQVAQSTNDNQVRYFHPEDEQQARAVTRSLQGIFRSVEMRDFVFFEPKPEPGLVEVWIH